MEYLLEYIFFLAIIFIGLRTSWDDYKTGKIRNKYIIGGLVYGCIAFIVLGLFLNLGLGYLGKVVLNSVLALVIGYTFWNYRFWAAGDAKLFALFAFLLPLNYYTNGYLPYFPASAMLLNVFIIVFVYLVIRTLLALIWQAIKSIRLILNNKLSLKLVWQDKKKYFKNNYKSVIHVFLLSLTAFLLIRLLSYQLVQFVPTSIFMVQMTFFIFMLMGYQLIDRLFEKKAWSVYLILIVILSYFLYSFFVSKIINLVDIQNTLTLSAVFVLFYKFGNKFLAWYHEKTEVYEIKTADLQAYMILHPEEIEALRVKSRLLRKQVFYPDGLHLEQVEPIKEICQQCNIEKLRLYKTFAFAPWIFLGLIVTVILKASLLHMALQLF